jgi:tetratricopeptide (TPR) repeat protein
MRWLSLGHPTLAANLTWLKVVQYVGERRGDERGWGKLRPLVDLVTDLDPRHGYAYQVGANAASSVGLLRDANAILEKGVRNVPDRYILPFHRAVNAFLYEGDHELAGRWFERAARTPGAPAHLREYVLAQYVKGDAAEAALSFLRQLEAAAEDDESRRAIRRQILRATLERDALALEAAADRYLALVGVRPIALAQLTLERLVPEIPEDPFGGWYYLDAEGRVRSTVEPKRFDREPAGPGRAAAGKEAWMQLKRLEAAQ